MKKKNLNNALVLAAALGLSGCATIVSENRYPVAIESFPEGANFIVTDEDGEIAATGTTPGVALLKSGNGYFSGAKYQVRFEKSGYEPTTGEIDSSVDSWYFGNVLFGGFGLIGLLLVDSVNGAMWELPDSSNVCLKNTPSPSCAAGALVGGSGPFTVSAAPVFADEYPSSDCDEVDGIDVDSDIPENPRTRKNVFVCVIANENYSRTGVENVPFAENDGNVFAEYAKRTLGVPEKRVLVRRNASSGEIRAAVLWMLQRAKVYPDSELIFYYSGHGVPAGTGKKVYLLPVDVSPEIAESAGISTDELFRQLGESDAARISVFLDSCFSGMRRDDGVLASSSRGVRLKAEAAPPRGKMVVFSAASSDETAFALEKKKHGLFTWCLLKKLQETKGNVSYSELGEYLRKRVPQISLEYVDRVQTPTCRWTEEFSAAGAPNRKLVE